MAKPTTLPRWATGAGAQITEPNESKKDEGWLPGEKPPAQYWNWWTKWASSWLSYLDSLTSEGLTWLTTQTFSSNLRVTGGTLDTRGVDFQIADAGGTAYAKAGIGSYIGGTNPVLIAASGRALILGSNALERVRIDSSGNVGIATAVPKSLASHGALTLNGSLGGMLAFTAGDAEKGRVTGYSVDANTGVLDLRALGTAGYLTITTGAAERVRIDVSGNVNLSGGRLAQLAANTSMLIKGNRDAADAGADVAISSTITRTAGLLFDVQQTGVSRFSVDYLGDLSLAGGAPAIRATGANAPLVLRSNRDAADSNPDFLLATSATRSGGYTFSLQNGPSYLFRVRYDGAVHVTGPVAPLSANSTLTLKGNRDAGDAGTDVVLGSTVTRTAGHLLDVLNNGSSVARVTIAGALYLTGSGQSLTAGATNSAMTIAGRRDASDVGTDVQIVSITNRTAGNLFSVLNGVLGTRLSVDYAGSVGVYGPGLYQRTADASVVLAGNRIAASTAADVILASQATRTAGVLLDVQNSGVGKFWVRHDGAVLLPGLPNIIATTATTLTLLGGLTAADAGVDVLANTSVTRTAGYLFQVSNGGATRLRVGYNGTVLLHGSGAALVAGDTNTSLSLQGRRDAGDAGADVVIRGLVTRTAGSIVDIQNNGSSTARITHNGSLYLYGTNQSITAGNDNSSLTLVGRRDAADAGADVLINTINARTAGPLLDVKNASVSKASIDYAGKLTLAGGLAITAGGATVTAGGLTVSAGGVAITGASTVTGTLGVTGNVTSSAGGVASGSAAFVGSAGDMQASRNSAPGTGVVYLGNANNRYLYFDGTNYQMPGGQLQGLSDPTVGSAAATKSYVDARFVAPSWTALAYQNGWADYGWPEAACAYAKDIFGRVWLKGIAAHSGATSLPIATLPVGFRPVERASFQIAVSTGAYTLRIDTDGTIVISSAGGSGGANLNGLSFPT